MASVYHFPVFTSLCSHNLLSLSHLPPTTLQLSHLPPPALQLSHSCSRIYAAAAKKPSASRKVKSDADLHNDIRNFLSSAGLPENHVPSTKELLENGRLDLANKVRRRGYKYVRQLLGASIGANSVIPSDETGQTENLEGENLEVLADNVSPSKALQAADLGLDCKSLLTSNPRTLSLKKKAAKFVEHGKLDTIEDSGFEVGYATRTETLNGNAPLSIQSSRNASLSSEQQTFENKNPGVEEMEYSGNKLNPKLILDLKERQLTKLKEQIEEERQTLSALQRKAETVIGGAERLVSETENELNNAEEPLFGLKEVKIEYRANADVVQLAGSFNGWHDKITMELDPSSDITTSTKPSNCRLWRTVLWLYPGVYEIKFIVDGDWRIDPERESVHRNSVLNNILRVDR